MTASGLERQPATIGARQSLASQRPSEAQLAPAAARRSPVGTGPSPTSTGPKPSPTMRIVDALDWLTWVAGLNLLWVAFSLVPVVGIAPATVAATTLARRRLRGDSEPLIRSFARVWRAEFRTANRMLLPLVIAGAVLLANALAFSRLQGELPGALVLASVAGFVLVLAVGAVAASMHAHYDLAGGPVRTAARFLVLNPGALALLAATAVLIGVITAFAPGILPFLSIGTWLTVSTALCLSFFARNDELLADRATQT